jgi:hypothetical protein
MIEPLTRYAQIIFDCIFILYLAFDYSYLISTDISEDKKQPDTTSKKPSTEENYDQHYKDVA